MKKTRKIISCFEMILIIGMVFSFCYFIKENDNSYEKTLDEIFGKTSASAFDLSSLSSLGGLGNLGISPQQIMGGMSETIGGGISVCIESKYGEKCQKSSNKECEASCLPGKCVEFAKINSVSQENWPDECELGTCYDKEYGTCSPNAPKWECVGDNVTWFDDPNANVPECLQGCCVIGTEAMLITEGQCKTYAQSKGIEYPTTNAKFDS